MKQGRGGTTRDGGYILKGLSQRKKGESKSWLIGCQNVTVSRGSWCLMLQIVYNTKEYRRLIWRHYVHYYWHRPPVPRPFKLRSLVSTVCTDLEHRVKLDFQNLMCMSECLSFCYWNSLKLLANSLLQVSKEIFWKGNCWKWNNSLRFDLTACYQETYLEEKYKSQSIQTII